MNNEDSTDQISINKVVNIPVHIEERLNLSSFIPAEIPVQFEFDMLGIKCEPIVNTLMELKSQQPIDKLPTILYTARAKRSAKRRPSTT